MRKRLNGKIILWAGLAAVVAAAVLFVICFLSGGDGEFPVMEELSTCAPDRVQADDAYSQAQAGQEPADSLPTPLQKSSAMSPAGKTRVGATWSGRVVHGDSRSPVTAFAICVCPSTRRGFHEIPPYNPFAEGGSLVQSFPGWSFRAEVQDDNGAFSIPFEQVAGRLVCFAAKGHENGLVNVGQEYKEGADVEVFLRASHETWLVVLDSATRAPIEGAELFLGAELEIDLSPDGKSFGVSSVSMNYPHRTGARSDRFGRIAVPGFFGRESVTFHLKRKGYGTVLFSLENAGNKGEMEVLLSSATGSIGIRAVDKAGKPTPALLRLSHSAAWREDLYAVTDAHGECVIEDVPSGKVAILATSAPAECVERFEPGSLRLRTADMNDLTLEGSIAANAEVSVLHGFSGTVILELAGQEKSQPVIYGCISVDQDVTGLSLHYENNGVCGNVGLDPRAPAFEVRLDPSRYSFRIFYMHRVYGWFETDCGAIEIRAGERRRLDIALPAELGLFRFAGRFYVPRPGQLLPCGIIIKCIEEGAGLVRTKQAMIGGYSPEQSFDTDKRFDLFLAPGKYRLEAVYPVGPGLSSSYPLCDMSVENDRTDMAVSLPELAVLDVVAVDRETKAPIDADCAYAVVRAGSDMKDPKNRCASSRLLPPGRYTVLVMVPGYSPATEDITVRYGEKALVLKCAMRKGAMGALGGKIVSRRTGGLVTGECDVQVFLEDLDLEITWVPVQAGSFSISGLLEGTYRLTVHFEGGKKSFTESISPGG